MEGDVVTVFVGNFAHSTWDTPLEILTEMIIGICRGKILFLKKRSELSKYIDEFNIRPEDIKYLNDNEMLIPGFVDCHIHACQFFNCGDGYDDLKLLEWLHTYVFPLEKRFKDIEFAKEAYKQAVISLVKNGTTTASYFETIYTDATLALCDIIHEMGQRALVGKVCMDRNEGSSYKEDTENSLVETDRFVKAVKARESPLITPVVTPRFALSCSERLMKGLADIARKYGTPIQTHINENTKEIEEVKKAFPNKTYAETYHSMGLLTSQTILAHNVHCTPEDLRLIKKQNAGVCHCPNSNTNLKSGMFCARKHLNAEIKLGLGTDLSGGYSTSIFDAMRGTTGISNLRSDGTEETEPIHYAEAFRLATLGGSKVLGLDGIVGNFEDGKQFDALVIELPVEWNQIIGGDEIDLKRRISKLIYMGDDRNIKSVFVAGRLIHTRGDLHIS